DVVSATGCQLHVNGGTSIGRRVAKLRGGAVVIGGAFAAVVKVFRLNGSRNCRRRSGERRKRKQTARLERLDHLCGQYNVATASFASNNRGCGAAPTASWESGKPLARIAELFASSCRGGRPDVRLITQ